MYPWGNDWDPKNCNWQGTWVGKYGLKFYPNEGVPTPEWEKFTNSEKFTKEIVGELGGMTLPVGSLPKGKSPYGCYDMAGNADEWCADWLKTDYYKLKDAKRNVAPTATKNPEGPSEDDAEECDFSGKKCKARVLRGGSWNFNPGSCRTVARHRYYPSYRSGNYYYGLRVAVVAGER